MTVTNWESAAAFIGLHPKVSAIKAIKVFCHYQSNLITHNVSIIAQYYFPFMIRCTVYGVE